MKLTLQITLQVIALIVVVVIGLSWISRNAVTPLAGIPLNAEVIDVSGRNLTSLPAEIGSYTYAVQLILDGNSLTGALPAEIRKMQRLETLSAKDNQLTGIPAEIGQLQHLSLIDFSGNNISTIPNELFNLQQPLKLVLTGNPLSPELVSTIRDRMPNAEVVFN